MLIKWVKAVGRGLAAAIYYVTESQFATIREVCEAVSAGALTRCGGLQFSRRDVEFAFGSDGAELTYRETNRPDGVHVEILNINTLTKRTALTVTFVNNNVVELTHAGRKRSVSGLSDEEKTLLWQILLKVRHALPPRAA